MFYLSLCERLYIVSPYTCKIFKHIKCEMQLKHYCREYNQMKSTESTKFLDDIEKTRHQITLLLEKRQELETKATSYSIQYNKIGEQNHGHNDKTGHLAILIAETDEKIKAASDRLKFQHNVLRIYLKRIEGYNEQSVLKFRYIYNCSYDEIADLLCISTRSVFTARTHALQELDKIIAAEKEKIRSNWKQSERHGKR